MIGLVGYGDGGWVAAGGSVCSDSADEDRDATGFAGGGGLSQGLDWVEGVTGFGGCDW